MTALSGFWAQTDRVQSWISSKVSPKTRASIINCRNTIQARLGNSKFARLIGPALLQSHLARPREVDVEVTSNCDADCIMCPRRQMRRKVGPMEFRLFKKIVDEAVSLNVERLVLNGYEEISTLKNCEEYIAYIRQKSSRIKIVVNTNGMRMDEALAKLYVDSSVNTVNVTIDGATSATYESIRRYLKLDVVESNVKKLLEIRNRAGKRYPLVRVGMILMPQNREEAEEFLAKWQGMADQVGISGYYSRMGGTSLAPVEEMDWLQTPCFLLWEQLPILSDGTVALCCDDWNGDAPQGNLMQDSIKQIWMSPQRAKLREMHVQSRAFEIPACVACRQPRNPPWWFPAEPR